MIKNKFEKKKKGFTLIELVIVLAVLAIIALIAIPNFTKVRNDSQIKADKRTAEQIEKITLMAVADEKINTKSDYTMSWTSAGVLTPVSDTDLADLLNGVNKPQKNGELQYLIRVYSDGSVSVGYSDAEYLAGEAFKALNA